MDTVVVAFSAGIVEDCRMRDVVDKPVTPKYALLDCRADMRTLKVAALGAKRHYDLETQIALMTSLHLVHRREPVSTVIGSQCFKTGQLQLTQESFLSCVVQPMTMFKLIETVWDTKAMYIHPAGGSNLLNSVINEWTPLKDHARRLAELPLEQWKPKQVHDRLGNDISGIGMSAPFHRGHHCRLMPCFAAWLLGRPRTQMLPEDWYLLLELLPGSRACLLTIGCEDYDVACAVAEQIGNRIAQSFDLYDLSCAACLSSRPLYHVSYEK